MKRAVNYLPNGPAPRKVLPGKVLVHNGVYLGISQDHQVGVSGFRAWWAEQDDVKELKRCDCVWRSDLGTHYRDESF